MVLQLKDKYLLIYILVFIKFAGLIFIVDGKCEAAGVSWGDWILSQWCMVLVGQFWVLRDLVFVDGWLGGCGNYGWVWPPPKPKWWAAYIDI